MLASSKPYLHAGPLLLRGVAGTHRNSSCSRRPRDDDLQAGPEWRRGPATQPARCRRLSRTIEHEPEIPLRRGPLAFEDAEHHRVAILPIGRDLVIAQHAVLLRPEPRDRFARAEVEPAGAELDGNALQGL